MSHKSKLSLSQRLRISQGYPIPIGKQKREGWKKETMFYIFKCPKGKHGLVTDYAHGEYGAFDTIPPYSAFVHIDGVFRRLDCQKCRESINVE